MPSVFLPGRHRISALPLWALAGVICLTATACAAQKAQHTATSGQTGGGACTTAQVDVALDLASAGVAAGTSLIPLDFTNVSSASCRLAGFAYVSFVTSRSGGPVGAAAAADRALAARTLLLGAGKTAHLWLRIVEASDLPASQCRPRTVAGLQVRMPGQAGSSFIAHQFTTCAKRIRGTDILTVEPFQAGRARPGTAQ
jgi:Protein of unknown function (DUF4232)